MPVPSQDVATICLPSGKYVPQPGASPPGSGARAPPGAEPPDVAFRGGPRRSDPAAVGREVEILQRRAGLCNQPRDTVAGAGVVQANAAVLACGSDEPVVVREVDADVPTFAS